MSYADALKRMHLVSKLMSTGGFNGGKGVIDRLIRLLHHSLLVRDLLYFLRDLRDSSRLLLLHMQWLLIYALLPHLRFDTESDVMNSKALSVLNSSKLE